MRYEASQLVRQAGLPDLGQGGPALETLNDARAYLTALPKQHHWHQAALLLLMAAADGAVVNLQAGTELIELLAQRPE
jgi:hypothetical protein